MNVAVGDYVLAINGEELKANDDPYRLLRNKADSPVQLTVNKTADDDRRADCFVSSDHQREPA